MKAKKNNSIYTWKWPYSCKLYEVGKRNR